MKIIGIVGSRRRNSRTDERKVIAAFNKIYEDGDEIVSGGCWAGADNMAEKIAKDVQCPIKIYHAKWKRLGKSAGHARNTLIAKDADVLIACVADDRKGGTEDTIRKYGVFGKMKLVLV